MKRLMMIAVLFAIPLICEAREPISNVGVYRDCVQWTTYNGMETSKQFELEVKEDDSISLVISFYRGSATCDSENKEILVEYRNFKILKDIGRGYSARMMTVQDVEKNEYFQLMFSADNVMAFSSDSLPVKYDFMRSLSLKKVE
jgi:hypothetical protein